MSKLGTIKTLIALGTHNELIHDFDVEPPDANTVFNGHLTLGPDGLIWGVEPNGGANGTRSVFRMNADGSNYTTMDMHLDGNPIGYMMPWYGLLYVPVSEQPEKLTQAITFPQLSDKTLGSR